MYNLLLGKGLKIIVKYLVVLRKKTHTHFEHVRIDIERVIKM